MFSREVQQSTVDELFSESERPEDPSPAFSFSDREWANYQDQLAQEDADLDRQIEAHETRLRGATSRSATVRPGRFLRETKWGRCPTHNRSRQLKLWQTGNLKGHISKVCGLWWVKDSTGRRSCWHSVGLPAEDLPKVPSSMRASYNSLRMRLARGGRE